MTISGSGGTPLAHILRIVAFGTWSVGIECALVGLVVRPLRDPLEYEVAIEEEGKGAKAVERTVATVINYSPKPFVTVRKLQNRWRCAS
jgi:hypothetical protein